MKGQTEDIRFSEDGEIIVVNRGDKGAAVINLALEDNEVNLATSLPEGEYRDNVYGRTFTVKGGLLQGTAEPETTYIIERK